jgi:peptidoglycan/xylan/chitin deacetylase (PgdA/CDA1 family)
MSGYFRNRLQQLAQKIQTRLDPAKGLILMYHRIAEVDIDPWGLCVTPQNFAEQLAVMQNWGRPIGLQQLNREHQHGKITPRSIALTFDDGYVDNLDRAKPLLETYNIPATVFVSTGYLGCQREFWWDELARILLKPGKLPDRLSLTADDRLLEWDLGTAQAYTSAEYVADRTCKAWEAPSGSRLCLYYSIWQALQRLSSTTCDRALDEIATWAQDTSPARSDRRPLTVEELINLSSGELVDIGAHTIEHPLLSTQPIALQKTEIYQSKLDLEKILARPVTSFSYPFGDRSTETISLVKTSGFNCACSTAAGIVWQHSDCFDLPRVAVENWNGREFASRLSQWFG